MQSHISLTRCPPQGRQLIKRHNTKCQVFLAGKNTRLLPHCHRNSRHMGWHGYWASPGDWQTHHSHHPGHQRNSFPVSTPVHSSTAGECGLLPEHNEHQIRSRRSRCFCLVFTPAALCWWAKIIIIIKPNFIAPWCPRIQRRKMQQMLCNERQTIFYEPSGSLPTRMCVRCRYLPISSMLQNNWVIPHTLCLFSTTSDRTPQ